MICEWTDGVPTGYADLTPCRAEAKLVMVLDGADALKLCLHHAERFRARLGGGATGGGHNVGQRVLWPGAGS